MRPSVTLAESGPLRWKSQTNGVPKLQGAFTLRDQQGFPLDMTYEIASDHGWEVDWVEALADAARQDISKHDAVIAEIGMLEPGKLEAVKRIFACGLMSSEGETFRDKALDFYRGLRATTIPRRTTGHTDHDETMFILPRPYKCNRCGHECEYSPSYDHPAPVCQGVIACPACWSEWLSKNIGVMEPKHSNRPDDRTPDQPQ